jgi:hypothetical protein
MLNPRFKSSCIVSSFVGREQGVVLVEEYDRKTLYPMLVKCHEHLHPLVRLNKNWVDQNIFWAGLQFGYFWANCKHKWTNIRACEEEVVGFHEISIGR